MTNRQPPRNALRFLRWFCREDYLDEIEGDLHELFQRDLGDTSQRADWKFWLGVIRCFRPDFIKAFTLPEPFIHVAMIRHNFLISFRGFLRHRSSFLINLLGLSSGLACVLFIYLWVQDEYRVDSFHEKGDRLYQLMTNYQLGNGIQTWENTPGPMAEAMLADFPEVEKATLSENSAFFKPKGILSVGDKHLPVEGTFVAENYFDVFTYPLLVGNTGEVLKPKQGIAISERMARRLFRSAEAAMGKTVHWNNSFLDTTFLVTGVFEDVPSTSTDQFDVAVSYDWLIEDDEYADHWSGGYAETYVLLREGVDIEAFTQKIQTYLADKHRAWKPSTQFLQPYTERYLHGTFEEGVLVGGRIEYVNLFSLVGLFILLIACINFMNLATARASKKMKEIGVKKVIGATRKGLIGQFLTESFLLVLISTFLAAGLVGLCLPAFNQLTAKSLSFELDGAFLGVLGGIILLTALLSGSYPAFYLSSFRPVKVLKGRLQSGRGETWVRKGLVVFQFSISVVFIVGVIVINRQMTYTQEKNLGYSRDQVVSFERPGERGDAQAFLAQIQAQPGVVEASHSVLYFLEGLDSQGGYSWTGDEAEKKYLFQSPMVGNGFVETLGMELVAGRAFSADFNDDYTKIVINESAARLMGLETPVGQVIQKGDESREIIGVVKDFQYGSIHKKVEPLIFRHRNFGRNILVKLQAGQTQKGLAAMEKVFAEFHPNYPFVYSFMDEEYQKLYEAESRVAALSQYFSILAIIISCLGLLGLAAFTAERRTKEIGIRKTLGADSWEMVKLLSGDFTQMVLLAIVIALPVSAWLTQNWLESFAYHIDLSWFYFVGAASLTLLLAWGTVGLQTLKTARLNPAACLRDE